MKYMKYNIVIKKKVAKNLKKLPVWVQKKMAILANDLREKGPKQPTWQNYSKLSRTEYHCHLGMSWVACWEHQNETIIIEVYYVGSREKAPY
jgi:mRNA-degrading endonuclease RelE of RelBE toxin-antitoxin system